VICAMQKTTQATAKWNKLLEFIHKEKVEQMNTKHWLPMCRIDERANSLFETYMNNKPKVKGKNV
tara:strand:- start:24 stop:218 length:195 start_codon:yes stop_codon:yes gene_type:complete